MPPDTICSIHVLVICAFQEVKPTINGEDMYEALKMQGGTRVT